MEESRKLPKVTSEVGSRFKETSARPRQRWLDLIKRDLSDSDSDINTAKEIASNRSLWRSLETKAPSTQIRFHRKR